MREKILVVFGTRPEAIKMAPLILSLQKHQEKFDVKVCVTGQHREMLDQVLIFFQIIPDYDLNVMKQDQNLYSLTADIILKLKIVLEEFKPQYVFVHGDTTTTLSASIASYYAQAKVVHVEAGLRTFDKYSPFPEEINRKVTACIADLHFAPTNTAKSNLINEGINENKIIKTGNTVIDALLIGLDKVRHLGWEIIPELQGKIKEDKEIILVTGHRRENHGKGFENISNAIKKIASYYPDVQIVYPVHLNPNVQNTVYAILSGLPNVFLINPLSYEVFIWLMNKAKLILTDSGGVQEEAPSLGKPVLVLRDTTERPEAVEAGTALLVGTDEERIFEEVKALLEDENRYFSIAGIENPYGDGLACSRIVHSLC